MLKKCQLIVLVIFLALGISCKEKPTSIYLRNVSIATGLDSAKAAQKGLILILNNAGCMMCEQFDIDLMKDEAYANTLYKDFVIQRVDHNVEGQKWLSRILNAGGVPIFIFFNRDRKLLGIKEGAISKKEMYKITKRIKNNQYSIDPKSKFGNAKLITTQQLPLFFENLLLAQAQWDRYSLSKDNNTLNGMEQKLNYTTKLQSSFYNNYLLTKFYVIKNDSTMAIKTAEKALMDDDPSTLYFNSELRIELKMVLNKGYNLYDDPYIGVDNIQQQLGKLKLGSRSKAYFKIKNLGKKELIIKKVLPDCSCTISNFTKTKILPQSVGNLELTFKASSHGEFSHTVYVESNAINGYVQLYIKGTVIGN